ncbi:MAG: hypothetical protein QNJ14_05500 [Woeseiaceae bacterium]|nr:hypothetical protein [Woeseiaceae bacterium]
MQLALLGIVLVLLIGWLVLRQRRYVAETTSPAPRKDPGKSAYHAVSIKFEANACNAAKAMTGRRFLASAAPRLPLPECDALECRCRFAHHDDRRSGKDRRSPFAARGYSPSGSGSYEKERRESTGRRENDRVD